VRAAVGGTLGRTQALLLATYRDDELPGRLSRTPSSPTNHPEGA